MLMPTRVKDFPGGPSNIITVAARDKGDDIMVLFILLGGPAGLSK